MMYQISRKILYMFIFHTTLCNRGKSFNKIFTYFVIAGRIVYFGQYA